MTKTLENRKQSPHIHEPANLMKMAALTTQRTSIILTKVPLKFIWRHKRSQLAKVFLIRESNGGGVTIHNHKFYYRAIGTKTVQGYIKTGPLGKKIYIYNSLFFDTVVKCTVTKKVFSADSIGKYLYTHEQRKPYSKHSEDIGTKILSKSAGSRPRS